MWSAFTAGAVGSGTGGLDGGKYPPWWDGNSPRASMSMAGAVGSGTGGFDGGKWPPWWGGNLPRASTSTRSSETGGLDHGHGKQPNGKQPMGL